MDGHDDLIGGLTSRRTSLRGSNQQLNRIAVIEAGRYEGRPRRPGHIDTIDLPLVGGGRSCITHSGSKEDRLTCADGVCRGLDLHSRIRMHRY
jgi:hypothetical protein